MPIEIKELIVRAVTNSDKKQERTNSSSSDGFIKKRKVQEMVVEVFKQMKNKKDR